MAANFDLPVNTTSYLIVWDWVRDNIDLVSTWFDEAEPAGSNIPTNAKKFSATNKRFEYWSGAAWLELLSKATTAYDIRAAVADLADLATSATTSGACTGNSATASLATNSLQLGGIVASSYTLDSDIRSIAFGGTAANTAAGARTNFSVYSKTEGDARYLLESNNLSDLTSPATARGASGLDVYSKGEVDTKLAITFTSSDHAITALANLACNAPAGYTFASYTFKSPQNTYVERISFVSINSGGSSITLRNNSLDSTTVTVTIIWKKIG